MELNGSYKSVKQMEEVLCEAFEHICVQDGSRPFVGGKSKVYTVIQELYPDSGNILQHTVWCRFTYCPSENWGQFKVSARDSKRFIEILTARNVRLGNNGKQAEQCKVEVERQASQA